MSLATMALLGVSALLLVTSIYAHGACTKPRFRGTVNTFSLTLPDLDIDDVGTDDCAHCLNGGGKGAVMAAANNDWRPWEPLDPKKFRHDAGLCGDPIKDSAPRAHEKGGAFGPSKKVPYMAVYKKNQIVEFTVDVTTNHNGFFEFFICDVGKCGGDINEKCFKNGHCHQLQRAKVPECEDSSSKECGPIDPDYPGRWIVPCRKGDHVGEHFMGGHFMQYHLPKNFACQDCVIQWYWASANSCNPPGFKEYFEKYPMKKWGNCPGNGGRSAGLSECGGPHFPEEFWSCADVRVIAGINLSANDAGDEKTRKSFPHSSTMEKNRCTGQGPRQCSEGPTGCANSNSAWSQGRTGDLTRSKQLSRNPGKDTFSLIVRLSQGRRPSKRHNQKTTKEYTRLSLRISSSRVSFTFLSFLLVCLLTILRQHF